MNFHENRLREIVDNIPALVAFLDAGEHYLFANRQHRGWLGVEPDDVTGRHVRDVIGESAYALLQSGCAKALSGVNASYSGDISMGPDDERFAYVSLVPLHRDDGRVEGVMMVISDLTELRDTQQALDASILRSQTVLDTAVDAIMTIDAKGIIQSCNASLERLFGYVADELIGQNVKMLMPSGYAAEHDDYLKRYVRTGERRIIGIGREVTGRRKDGTEFPLHLAVGEFAEDGRQYFTGFIRDMSTQREAEQKARAHLEQLAHMTRLSAIDNLASGISHEINQPLTAIVTMSQALLRALRAGKSDRQMLEDTLERIVTQGARANTIVQQMREFARKEKHTETSIQDIDSIITDVLQLLDYEIGQFDVEVRTEFNAGGAPVQVNRIQVEQVILNLIQNAVHAMAEVPRDRILTLQSDPPDEYHPYVRVSVADTGPGLPEFAEDNVFDPFFTTKEQGMGQGLSISRSIVESHGGIIRGRTNKDKGATFEFTLPVDAEGNGA